MCPQGKPEPAFNRTGIGHPLHSSTKAVNGIGHTRSQTVLCTCAGRRIEESGKDGLVGSWSFSVQSAAWR